MLSLGHAVIVQKNYEPSLAGKRTTLFWAVDRAASDNQHQLK